MSDDAAELMVPEAIAAELPPRLVLLANPGFTAGFEPAASYRAQLESEVADKFDGKCARFKREVGRTFGRSILPEPAAGEVRVNDRGECLLRYRDRRARLLALRWGGLVQLRERLTLTPRSRVGAVLTFLEEVLAFSLDDGGRAVAPKRELSFGERGGAYLELAAPANGFGGRYSRLMAYFDGELLLVHFIPMLVRPRRQQEARYPSPDDVVHQLRTARMTKL